MALRKPLVLNGNEIEELASSDTLDASVAEVDVVQLTNNSGGAAVIGAPVYANGAGTFHMARANASGTKDVIGLVKDTSIADSASGGIQTNGVLSATTTQWDAVVTGASGGLVVGTKYMVDPDNAGKLVTYAATIDAGEFVCPVGIALSTTEMLIRLGETKKRN